MTSDTFLETAHTLDLLADHPHTLVINSNGFYYVDAENILHSISLTKTEYNSIRHTLISTLQDR